MNNLQSQWSHIFTFEIPWVLLIVNFITISESVFFFCCILQFSHQPPNTTIITTNKPTHPHPTSADNKIDNIFQA
uniref:Uncharacterized protein n=1 Tax=Octopus bimaculoides TaxID=37653 RepID=A0A0L8FRQ1_OCTBM